MNHPAAHHRTLLLAAACWASFVAAGLAQSPPGRSAQAIVLLDGSELPASGIAVEAGQVTGQGIQSPLLLDDLRQIRLAAAGPDLKASGAIAVELVGGGRLTAETVALADDVWTVKSAAAGELKLPIDVVRAIAFDRTKLPADYHKALETPSADFDRIFVLVDKASESVTGLVASVDEKGLTIEHDGKERTLSREQVIGIVLAQSIAAAELPPSTARLVDGSRLGGELQSIKDGDVVLKVGSERITLAATAVRSIDVRSDRMAFLSDLKPVAAEHSTIVTLARPWQRDRSCSGKTMQIGQRTFEKGIGVHSRSLLTFDLGGDYTQFAAVVGIDAATEGKGDCVMSILGDGRSLWSQQVKGTDPAKEVTVDVSGVQQLTLLVEPGEELDLADHANWADARVIRTKK